MGNVERETNTHKGWYLNIETMTGKGRELADMMERRNVDTLCLQKTKWKESKVRNIGGAANYSTMELMVKKWDKDSGERRAV